MATHLEDRFGETTSLGTTYTQIGPDVPSATKWNILMNVANRLTGTVKLRAYIATSSWTTGEPTGGDLVAAIAFDMPIYANSEPVQISGIIIKATEQVIVRSDTASALDITLNGVAIT